MWMQKFTLLLLTSDYTSSLSCSHTLVSSLSSRIFLYPLCFLWFSTWLHTDSYHDYWTTSSTTFAQRPLFSNNESNTLALGDEALVDRDNLSRQQGSENAGWINLQRPLWDFFLLVNITHCPQYFNPLGTQVLNLWYNFDLPEKHSQCEAHRFVLHFLCLGRGSPDFSLRFFASSKLASWHSWRCW